MKNEAMDALPIRTVQVTRYVTPLREGGSLPAIAEADDDFLYALKFRGAGQGVKALIAELIGGEIARRLGLRVPEIVFAEVDEAFGRTEPDEEIQDLLKASKGLNLALHYLSGAITFDPAVNPVDPLLASQIVWLDGLLMNVDRTARNTNMLVWNRELWLIDHGASLYFHHNWDSWREQVEKPFGAIKDHVLLRQAERLDAVDATFRVLLTPEVVHEVVQLIPTVWLEDPVFSAILSDNNGQVQSLRDVYAAFLNQRIESSSNFVKEAQDARTRSF